MSGLFSRKKRREKKELMRKKNEETLRIERLTLERACEAEAWFCELSEEERAGIIKSLPPVARCLLSMSPGKSSLFFYSLLTVLLSLAGAGLFVGGGWSVAGLLCLFASWALFRSGEKRLEHGLILVDPISSALVTEVYIRESDIPACPPLASEEREEPSLP